MKTVFPLSPFPSPANKVQVLLIPSVRYPSNWGICQAVSSLGAANSLQKVRALTPPPRLLAIVEFSFPVNYNVV